MKHDRFYKSISIYKKTKAKQQRDDLIYSWDPTRRITEPLWHDKFVRATPAEP